MPTYEYRLKDGATGCPQCERGFECVRRLADPPLTRCPACGAEVVKVPSAPNLALAPGKLDDRARQAGFHKFQRVGKGEYEKRY